MAYRLVGRLKALFNYVIFERPELKRRFVHSSIIRRYSALTIGQLFNSRSDHVGSAPHFSTLCYPGATPDANPLLTRINILNKSCNFSMLSGAPERIRTSDPQIRSLLRTVVARTTLRRDAEKLNKTT